MLSLPKVALQYLVWPAAVAAAAGGVVLLGFTWQVANDLRRDRLEHSARGIEKEQATAPESAGDAKNLRGAPSMGPALATVHPLVQAANASSAAKFNELVNHWRGELRDARNPMRLRWFVNELTGISQKFHQGVGLLDRHSGEQRVLASFRKNVVDERQLVTDLEATVEGYERFLAEQDRQILEAAGALGAQQALVQVTIPAFTQWGHALEPVVALAVDEARRDMGRFAANWVASDAGGDGVRRLLRGAGLDRSEPGSWGDLFLDVAADVGTGLVVDTITDPTERIITRLSQEMTRAEEAMLDGDSGLAGQLGKLKSFHEQARAEFLASVAKQ